MHVINRSKNWMPLWLAALLFILCASPVSAAEEAAKTFEIRVKVGSNQMKMNGAAVKIQPPYQTAGTTMVPLSVLTNTKGFGAKLQLKNNKIITLTYQKHVIVLTKGSKAATINGKKATLTAAPVDKQGVTMVPLKIIVKTFGAKLSSDAKTKELIIKGTVAASGDVASGIDPDSGKSQIGDSYFKWSMNYPTGLVQDYQTDLGEWISFSDVKGDYYLAVSVEEAADPLDTGDKRDLLIEYSDYDETMVDMKTSKRSTGTFERMITKSKSGFFYEYRAIQANGNFYILVFGKKAKSASELDANSGLLDSFKPSFSSTNKSLKDLARIKDGKIAFENSDYGLKLQLPKDWRADKGKSNPYFYGPDDSYLLLEVSSINAGDTLDNWVDRRLQLYKDLLAETYRKTPEVSSITWNGIPAKLVKSSYSNDTITWMNEYEVYVFNGEHKYYIDYTFKEKNKDNTGEVVDQLLNGMKVDFAHVEKSFGELPDPNDIDITTMVTKTNKTYGYSITLPKYWTKGVTDMESEEIDFSGFGIDLTVSIEEDSSLSEVQDMLEGFLNLDFAEIKLDSKSTVTYAGVSAAKYLISTTKEAPDQFHLTIYILENKGNVYIIEGELYDAYASDLNRKQLEDALNSFQLTN
ncbi:stalk domain-containing protein [Cohnella sp.]|uniref:stalk domain-containing protein n=1 Tax=Cohnella sp. TaxID=1883426 RepID=UPI003568A891